MFNNLGTPLLNMFKDNKTIPRYQTSAQAQLEKIELSILEQQDLTEIKKIEANRLFFDQILSCTVCKDNSITPKKLTKQMKATKIHFTAGVKK